MPDRSQFVIRHRRNVTRQDTTLMTDASQQSRVALFYTIFAVMLAAGIALTVIGPRLFTIGTTTPPEMTPVQPTDGDFNSNAVRIITNTDDWNAAIASGRCVLFVNCDWNVAMVAFRQPFSDFAAWSNDNTDYKTISITLDADSKDEMWHTIQDLWQDNSISPGGLKTYGGAGRVVWFNDGQVIDYAWCTEVLEVDKLKSRTKDAFQ